MPSKSDRVVLRRLQNKLELMRESLSELDFDELPELELAISQLHELVEEIIDAE